MIESPTPAAVLSVLLNRDDVSAKESLIREELMETEPLTLFQIIVVIFFLLI